MLSGGKLVVLLLVGSGLVALTVVLRRYQRLALILWLAVLVGLPVWFGISIKAYFPPASIVGIIVLIAWFDRIPRRFGAADFFMAVFFVSCVAPLAIGRGTISTVFGATALWLVAYSLGRMAPSVVGIEWIYRFVAIVFTVVAVGAIVEYLTGVHIFENLGPANSMHATWGSIQVRGGVARAEGAFGHSIALGASLAAAVPMIVAAKFPFVVRQAMVLTVAAGILVTFSRSSLVSAIFALALLVIFGRYVVTRKHRIVLGIAAIVAVIPAVAILSGVVAEDSQASGSAAYRGSLVHLVSAIGILGRSSATAVSASGDMYFLGFQSIDDQLLFTGLTYGWFALAAGLVLLICAVALTVSGRATAPVIAIVAQIPLLAVVALITQYSMWFWFVAGLAVASVSPDVATLAGRVDAVDRELVRLRPLAVGSTGSMAEEGRVW